jgi:thiamine biosynthesis lipoprotein
MKPLACSVISALLLMVGTVSAVPGLNKKRNQPPYIFYFENVLGTSLELKVASKSRREAIIAEVAALKEIGRLANILSAYDPGSEFSRWFRTFNQPVHISPELFEVLSLFDKWRLRSGGALDASAESINKLWREAAHRQSLPSPEDLVKAVAALQQQHWKLDSATHTAIHLSFVPLALNTFVKSYIIKRAVNAAMAFSKVRGVVLNIGGDLLVCGDLTENVQIRDPIADAENDPPIDYFTLHNRAVATSGNYRRGELINGHWYSHIVDPRTGQPADGIISATVIAPNAIDAGALATVFNVLTPAESVQLASTIPDIEYLMIMKTGVRIASKGWKELAPTDSTPVLNRPRTSDSANLQLSWNTNFELMINLELSLPKNDWGKRPFVAVWIEGPEHVSIRTLAVWYSRPRWLPELKAWYRRNGGHFTTDTGSFRSITSATRPSGKYSLKWDGRDNHGNLMKPGSYLISIEAVQEHSLIQPFGSYTLLRSEIDCNESAKFINLTGNGGIISASLTYRKKITNN